MVEKSECPGFGPGTLLWGNECRLSREKFGRECRDLNVFSILGGAVGID